MTDIAMTDFERAQLKLLAFRALDGWGNSDEKGKHVPWDLERRKDEAEFFFEWMIGKEEPENDEGTSDAALREAGQ